MSEALSRANALGQPVGPPVPGWTPRALPPATPMVGRFCRVEPLDVARHAGALFRANAADRDGRNWTYLSIEPPRDEAAYRAYLAVHAAGRDPMVHAIVEGESGEPVGLASFMRIDPVAGSIEVGHINFSPRLQRRPAATEAMALMMARVFDELGYRRYEWKCDSLNAPSRAAAERLGFRFEGIFRQALVVKDRNRDTAWYSVIDSEWPLLKRAFAAWLDPSNFDAAGRQRASLGEIRRGLA
jgi:RimJ/RimL family protein N-acetyltransferase